MGSALPNAIGFRARSGADQLVRFELNSRLAVGVDGEVCMELGKPCDPRMPSSRRRWPGFRAERPGWLCPIRRSRRSWLPAAAPLGIEGPRSDALRAGRSSSAR